MSTPTDPATAAAMQAALAAAIKEVAYAGSVNKAYFAAVFGITVYDLLVQLGTEYSFIWRGENSYLKFSYIFCRYWNIGVCILCMLAFFSKWSQNSCDEVVRILSAISAVTIFSCANLLAIRTRAVWTKNVYVTVLLALLVIAELATLLVTGQVFGEAVPILPPGAKGNCFPAAKSRGLVAYWAMPLVVDGTATILMLVKAWSTFRMGSSLAKVVVRDGLLYFVIISAFNCLNLGFWAAASTQWQGVNSALALSLSSVLACRMILQLKAHSFAKASRNDISSGSVARLANITNGSSDVSAPTYLSFAQTRSEVIDEKDQSPREVVDAISYRKVEV